MSNKKLAKFEAVLLTHGHADAILGLDSLREADGWGRELRWVVIVRESGPLNQWLFLVPLIGGR